MSLLCSSNAFFLLFAISFPSFVPFPLSSFPSFPFFSDKVEGHTRIQLLRVDIINISTNVKQLDLIELSEGKMLFKQAQEAKLSRNNRYTLYLTFLSLFCYSSLSFLSFVLSVVLKNEKKPEKKTAT